MVTPVMQFVGVQVNRVGKDLPGFGGLVGKLHQHSDRVALQPRHQQRIGDFVLADEYDGMILQEIGASVITVEFVRG